MCKWRQGQRCTRRPPHARRCPACAGGACSWTRHRGSALQAGARLGFPDKQHWQRRGRKELLAFPTASSAALLRETWMARFTLRVSLTPATIGKKREGLSRARCLRCRTVALSRQGPYLGNGYVPQAQVLGQPGLAAACGRRSRPAADGTRAGSAVRSSSKKDGAGRWTAQRRRTAKGPYRRQRGQCASNKCRWPR